MSSDSESDANESMQNSGGDEVDENEVDEAIAETLPAEEKEVTWEDLVIIFVIF